MSDNQYEPESGASTCNKQWLESRASTSNHTATNELSAYRFQKGVNASRRKKAEIVQLHGRLRVLEEEAEMLKEALLGSMNERTKLKTEINEHFSPLRHYLKDRRVGLLQVLWQDSNPSIINKGLRAPALSYDSTSSAHEI